MPDGRFWCDVFRFITTMAQVLQSLLDDEFVDVMATDVDGR